LGEELSAGKLGDLVKEFNAKNQDAALHLK
jgi:hypothetical protein